MTATGAKHKNDLVEHESSGAGDCGQADDVGGSSSDSSSVGLQSEELHEINVSDESASDVEDGSVPTRRNSWSDLERPA